MVHLINYPNPFIDQTTIHYDLSSLPNYKKAELKINDMLGHEVMNFSLDKESDDFIVSKNKLGGGIYFYSVVVDGRVLKTNKLVVF
jgi:hypothetical protein